MHTESPSATNVATSSKDKQARSLFGRKKPKAKPGPNAPSTAAADDELLDLHNFEDLEFERDHQIVLDNELAWKLQEEENQAAMNALLTPSESLEFVAPSPALPPKPIAYTTPYLPVNGVKIVKTPMSMKPDEVTSPTFPGQKPHEQPQTHKPDEASYFPPTSTSTSTPTPTPRPRVSSISPLASIRTSVAYSKPAPPAPTPISSPAPSHAPTIPVNFPTPVIPNIVPPTHHLQSSYTQPHQPPPPVQHAPFLIQTPVMGGQAQLYPQIQEAAYPPIGYNTHYSPDTPVASHVKPVQTPNYGFSMMYLNRNNGVGQSPAVDLSNMVDVKVAVEDAPNDDDELVQKTEKMHPPAVPFRRRAASMSSEKEQVDMHHRRPFSTQVSTLVIQRHVETDETDDDNFPRHSSAAKMSTAARYTKSLYGGNDESRPAIPTRQPSIRPPPPLPSPPVIEEGPAKLTITTVTSIPATRPKPPPKQSPTVAPKPSPKPSPKQSPTVAPKPSPKPSLKQSPTVAPKPSPKHSPTVAPKPPPKTSPTVAPKPSPDADSATRSRHTSFHQIMPTEPIHNPFTDPTEIPDDPQPLETETYDHTPHPHQQHWTSTPSAEVYEDHTSSPHQQHWNSTPSAEVYEDHTSSPHQQHWNAEVYEDHTSSPHQQHWNAEVYEDHTSSPHQQHWDSTPSAEVYEDHTSSLHQQHWNSTPSAEVYEDHTSSPHQQHWTPTPSAEVYEDNTSSPHQQHWTSTPSAEVYEDHTPSPHQQHWTSTPSAEVYEDHAPSPHQQHQHWISTSSAEVYEDHTPSPHQQHWTSAPSAEVCPPSAISAEVLRRGVRRPEPHVMVTTREAHLDCILDTDVTHITILTQQTTAPVKAAAAAARAVAGDRKKATTATTVACHGEASTPGAAEKKFAERCRGMEDVAAGGKGAARTGV
ncbi:hypothetical protein BC936DRAFT_150116 [Jimgerdemannia flammicorona]|uniref:Uncharacterized protein n=1 Tax=Jimgerdemannia flammicorona TaxID=994334 RepID=A0A433CZG6_9FUNG|nr:hypothetical protein BC936DRAFT_150116 [Jimgerdemannia flammicorona]